MTDRILFDPDLNTSILKALRIGIIGYGSQGRAQALNLRDSGFPPSVGLRPGSSFERAFADGFKPVSPREAVSTSDLVMVLTPDETHPDVCERHIFPAAREGARVGFAAAFTVHYGVVRVPDGLRPVLIAPKGPGGELRRRFEVGEGIPALVASLEGDTKGLEIAEAYAGALGCGRAGIVRTTFREEAIADLFGEQCVLVGGLVELMKASFNTLVDRGYTPEVAYIECIAEVEYIASLISRVGLSDLDRRISSTASYGGRTRGPRVVGEGLRERLEHILDEIEDGRFYKEFKRFAAQKESKSSHTRGLDLIERARASFRDGDEHEK